MKHVQWVIVRTWIDDAGLMHAGVESSQVYQTLILEDWIATKNGASIRIGTVVEPSMKMALRDLKDAIHQEIVHPFMEWIDGIFPTA